MGDLRIHPRTFIYAGLSAFIFVWLANRALTYGGLSAYQA